MNNIEKKCIDAIRILGIDIIENAKSGHPGIVLGAAPILFTLFTKHINVDPGEDKWFNRDRFVLSAGHGSALQYALYHLCGFSISLADLKKFRQLNSITSGHPEYNHTPGVDATTGPLGQGIAMGVGMAITEKFLEAKFNEQDYAVCNHYTYILCGDGDLQEGITNEAISLAGHLGLGKIILLYDSNDIQLDGSTSLAFSDNIQKKFESMNWHYVRVEDGNDIDEIDEAIIEAKGRLDKPSIIEIKTQIGYGSPLAGDALVHGSPIGENNVLSLRETLGWSDNSFVIPDDVYAYFDKHVNRRGFENNTAWNKMLSNYEDEYPDKYNLFDRFIHNDYQVDFDKYKFTVGAKEATRNVCGKLIDLISREIPYFIGGSADLSRSTKIKGIDGNFSKENRLGRNINFGVREHAMAAIANGMMLHEGVRSFCGGFFAFSDYMKPAVRLAALMKIPTLFIFSHDSIAVGEDGPTHQPIEQIVTFRSIPNLNLIRPCDANETKAAMQLALESTEVPTVILTTRQEVTNFKNTSYDYVKRGAYIISEAKNPMHGILIAAGSEVELAIEVQKELLQENIHVRVVSMPSMYLFDKQTTRYQESVLPKEVKKLAIEMASPMSWYKYTSNVYGIESFGASGTLKDIVKHFGFTVENIKKVYKKIE